MRERKRAKEKKRTLTEKEKRMERLLDWRTEKEMLS